ncbi:gamma-type small acid-soluble spore protein [Bacillus sp. DNRA2]|uniref:gamma-type small acid-soluble spore protein n=1 Tax=Bacillus sp. DNRA2 TaxID=2723053 RepID=UPI00145F67C3|nr:gamma-type small acid-soluble spore protein [Bacillus sp. DNRA2]NMD71648.1 gamma-type small acid-soluble spore protein [Bacillus sp. DNRA2]
MNGSVNQNNDQYTVVGTNIDEVKRLNAQSGLSYNEVKELLARTTGVKGEPNRNTNFKESNINNKQ